MEFVPFPKIPRLTGGMIVTEKIDGTNAAIGIKMREDGDFDLWAQSRTRIITPDDDNYGFAKWVYDHVSDLLLLGEGMHFGEWWGEGIQRGYGVKGKRFSLFNTGRWTSAFNEFGFGSGPVPDDVDDSWHQCREVPVCSVVPLLLVSGFDTRVASAEYDLLKTVGSRAALGFDNPEGIVVYDAAGRNYYKLNDAKQGAKHGLSTQ